MKCPKVMGEPAGGFLKAAAILAMMLGGAMPAWAAEYRAAPRQPAAEGNSQDSGPSDPEEVKGFLDSLMTADMSEYHIAGAAVSVVRDGELLYAGGYGLADVGRGIPVDPVQTIFSIGSVGKLFTWTAVMQLVEQGKLDLDADINTYLDFRIPDTFPEPITLKHLMTHTSGFEDRLLGGAVTDARDLVPPREWIVTHMSKRVQPPGHIPGYANINAILAGYIVARVSGEPYEQYIQNHIFAPLGMLHSSVESPLPPGLRELASLGYTYEEGVFQPFPGFLAQPGGYPSGMHQSSVADMARFMIAHLQGGLYANPHTPNGRIMSEATARRMQETLFAYDPRMLGTAYGFFDLSDNGQKTLGSSGYLPPMHSMLLLLPDDNVGVFVAYNSKDSGILTAQHVGFQRAFFDHYYPVADAPARQAPADFPERADRFTGVYGVASRPHTTFIKLVELFGAYRMQVSDPGDGTLLINVEGLPFQFVEVEPLFFRQVNGPFSAVFREDARGHITELYTDVMPQYGAEKLRWYETTSFHVALVLSCVAVFVATLLVAGVRALRRRGARNVAPEPRTAVAAQRFIEWISALNLLFLLGVALWGNPPTELHAVPLITKVVLGVGVVAALLTPVAVGHAIMAWRARYWTAARRGFHALATLAAVGFVWFLNYWNLLGWRY